MLLAIDIGNTNVKCGLFDGSELRDHFTTTNVNTINNHFKKQDVTEMAISSVVPEKTKQILQEFLIDTKIKTFIINKDSSFHLKINYKTPKTLGMDRLCSCEGAFSLMNRKMNAKSYLVTIDFGTATTINVVKSPGTFIGGVIAPGIQVMYDSLNTRTSQLPSIDTSDYKTIVGNDTNSAIASGVIHSTIGLINQMYNHLNNLDDCEDVRIFITGGMANQIKDFLEVDFIYNEFLVIKGVKAVHELNRQ
jgi:type III pantothenate kinase